MSLVESDILRNLEILKDDNHDLWQVYCGHDLICILSIGLCKILGSKNTNEVKPDLLERELRLAYEYTYFIKTQLYLSLRTWEKNNNPYTIFKADDNITASSKPA